MQKNDELFEKLSALVDGENHDDNIEKLLEQVSSDDSCMRAWQTYHVTRDVLQRDYHSALPADFCAGISARLDEEETYSFQASAPAQPDSVDSSNVVAFDRPATSPAQADTAILARSNRRWKSAAVLGMAASVALAAVAGLQLLNKNLSLIHI